MKKMKNNFFKILFFTLLTLILNSCSLENNKFANLIKGGIGGTGIFNGEGGIGGTGIIGTITKFGSIIVNGIRIEYKPNQKFEAFFGKKNVNDLKIGQIVRVIATSKNNIYEAQKIIQQTNLIGYYQSKSSNNVLNISNRKVKILNTQIIENNMLDQITPNDVLGVSGFWSKGILYATELEKLSKKILKRGEVIYGGEIEDLIKNKIILQNQLDLKLSNVNKQSFTYLKISNNSQLSLLKSYFSFNKQVDIILSEELEVSKGKTFRTLKLKTSNNSVLKKISTSLENWKNKPKLEKELNNLIKVQSFEKKINNTNINSQKNNRDNSGGGNSGGGNSSGGNSSGGNSGGGNSGCGNSGGGNSGGGNSGGGNSGGGNSGGGNSGGGNSGGGKKN